MFYALMIILKILEASNAKCGIVKKDNEKMGTELSEEQNPFQISFLGKLI